MRLSGRACRCVPTDGGVKAMSSHVPWNAEPSTATESRRASLQWRGDSGNGFRSYGKENGEFDAAGRIQRRYASIHDLPTGIAIASFMEKKGHHVIEATRQFEDYWVEHRDAIANATLVAKTDSWYMGSNVTGKPRRLLSYIGGVGRYREECLEVANKGYEGFKLG